MPGGDGTGPRGMGPGTGWGMGPCGGRGYGRRRISSYLPKDELEYLKAEKADIDARIKEIEQGLKGGK